MSPQSIALLITAIAVLAALGCIWGAMRCERRWRLVHDLPTSKTTGVFIGLVELAGKAQAAQPLTSPLAELACVYHRWSVDEHWSRTVVERYTDSKGTSCTRVRHDSGWTTVASGGDQMAFILRDDAGEVQVVPEGADVTPLSTMDQQCTTDDPMYYGKGPAEAVGNSDHRRRFTESAIPIDTPLYVIGQARERTDVVAAEIARDPLAPLFVISARGEAGVSSRFYWSALGLELLGLIVAAGAPFIIGSVLQREPPARFLPASLSLAGYLACWGVGWMWMVYNGLVELRQRVRQAWSNIDVQLKRRFDLLPNLVAIVERLRDHERDTQTELALMRSQLMVTPPGLPGPDPRACAGAVIALAERYPTLTSDVGFQSLMRSLRDTEDRIALARAYYNDIAADWNIRLERIPDCVIARMARMTRQEPMAANGFERGAIEVRV
ncbi:MAG: LemA family protein [Planctomycetes bacterium]|nr:LemA family protein [Planctomycetota bacterium]